MFVKINPDANPDYNKVLTDEAKEIREWRGVRGGLWTAFRSLIFIWEPEQVGTWLSEILKNHTRHERQADLLDRAQQHVDKAGSYGMMQAANYLKINYSSAKFIFSQYRDKNIQG